MRNKVQNNVQRRLGSKASLSLASAASFLACDANDSPTELNPDGPPMVRQIFPKEVYQNQNGLYITRNALGFGSHPDADPTLVHPVTAALATGDQTIRVVMDELLLGNYLEQIACRSSFVGDDGVDDAYDDVPEGATDQDIAKCAVQDDILATSCVGDLAVCVGPSGPVGVLDSSPFPDGAADDTRFISSAVVLNCGAFTVPLDLDNSYWYPSGNQLIPSGRDIDALGPAIVLKPALGLPTGQTCTVQFAGNVVDKDGIQPCAPTDGDITTDCTPGDTALATFKVEPFRVSTTVPANNLTGVNLTTTGQTYSEVVVFLNSRVALESFLTATVDEGGTPRTDFTVEPRANDANSLALRFPGGFDNNTVYTITFGGGCTDGFGVGLPAPHVLTFTTDP